MSLKDCRDIAQGALAVMKVLQSLPPQRQMEILAAVQVFVNCEAQRAIAAANTEAQRRTRTPADEEFHA